LQATPAAWKAEDSILIILMMFDMLQSSDPAELMIDTMRNSLPPEMVEFLLPKRSRFDASMLDRDEKIEYAPMAIPGPGVIDLRNRLSLLEPTEQSSSPVVDIPELVIGSNNWAVAGSRSVHGGAILANDMHLALTSPGIWYRVELRWGDHVAAGLTLPGVPGLVSGSNEHVAWGFTNTQGDFADHIIIEVNPRDENQYRTPDGWEEFDTITETIQVRHAQPETLILRNTRWGIVSTDSWKGSPLVLKWVGLIPEAVNLNQLDLLYATTVEEAVEVSRTMGLPSQNVLIADDAGRIAWVVAGYIPKRKNFKGLVPQSWADGTFSWDGSLPESLRPMIIDPPSGILYSANNRTIDDDSADLVGHAWGSGYRASRIKALLESKEKFDERDLLAQQLDTRTIVFDYYRDLILDASEGQGKEQFAAAREIVSAWNGTADVDQSALLLLDTFRRTMHAKLFTPLTRACRDYDPNFRYRWSMGEETLRRIMEELPAHFLPRRFDSWEELLEEALDQSIKEVQRRQPDLGLDTPWGDVNIAAIGHPLAELAPQMAGALRMPADPLPGHWTSLRMATPRFGASARMVVSPGREDSGILHMPSGQSGHPLSPHFRDGHNAWVEGLPTSFRPGPIVHRLKLMPID
ncbi:MAG: penicillin acylase family protein, partial [Planctomycetota bacterium]|nr:penicillin acylase family protein [Planctomycetota bacterium]